MSPLETLAAPTADKASEVARLERSFAAVDRLARQLELAYRELGGQAEGLSSLLSEPRAPLPRSSNEIEGLIEAIPCGIVIAQATGTITRLNRAAERVIGRDRSELIGRDVRTLVDHKGEAILLLGQDHVRPGATVERLVSTLNGSKRYLSGCIAELPQGERLEILADQTEVTHLRAQVHRLDTLAAMGEMAAGIAHEIRNPMSAVEGFAGLLEKTLESGRPPEREILERYTNRIRRGVAEVNSIISGLLMWARPEKAAKEIVDLKLLTQEAMTGLGEGLSNLAIEETAPGTTLVAGDAMKLKLALGNLLRNAREAAGPNGVVSVAIERGDKSWNLRVEDSGPGVAEEVRERLFQPFTTNKTGGTGLGLALTRKFVELHGGTVEVGRSSLGGAAFLMRLPIHRPRGVTR